MSRLAPRSINSRAIALLVDEVLQRRRLMVDVTRLQLCAALKQEPGDLGIRGTVQRGLAVAAAGVNQTGIGAHQRFQLVQETEARRRPRRHAGAARDQRPRCVQRQSRFENSSAARPPGRACIDVGAMAQQDVDQRQVLFRLMNGGWIESKRGSSIRARTSALPGQQLMRLLERWAGANSGIEPSIGVIVSEFDLLRHRGPGP